MCGATDQQKDLEQKQAAFYDTLTQHYQEAYGAQSAILSELTKIYKPIFDKGPDQEGFGAAEKTALETNATERTAQSVKQAAQFVHGEEAARGGSDFIPNGQEGQIDATLGMTALNERTSLENQIITNDFDTGRRLWAAAGEGLAGAAHQYDPNAAASVANTAGEGAATTANEIAQADNSIWSTVVGGLSGIAGAAVGGWAEGKAKGNG
jgi:hypothetical protein